MASERYAIYFAPAQGSALDRLASEWLGRSAYTNANYVPGGCGSIGPEDQAAMTAEPRRYGFHATLKPPFGLAEGRSPDELLRAVEAFAARRPVVRLDGLRTARIGRFIALVPTERSSELESLAADCVRTFDGFRAAPDEAELEKRRARGLTTRQEELLLAWGYPYVMEEFRFHLTLTGPLPAVAACDAAIAVLSKAFDPVCEAPFPIDRISIFRQPDRKSDFRVFRSFPLGTGCQAGDRD